jgi:acyl carrier protein
MYAEVLATEQVGIDDNFFTTLGGHSLLATQLVSRIRDIFQIDLPLRVVFDKPTVRELTGELLRDPSGRARLEKVADVLLTVANQSDVEIERELAKKSATISNGRAC